MKLSLLKEWRILLVLLFILVSILAISPAPKAGVVVRSISSDSPLAEKLVVGDIITWVEDVEIKDTDDFYQFETYTGALSFIHSGELSIADIEEPGLGVVVEKRPLTNINFGMDLVGGTRVLLEPVKNVSDEVMNQILTTLETRINIFGLREAKFQKVVDLAGNKYAQIEMAGGSIKEVEDLLAKQGMFEAKIPKLIIIEDNYGTLKLGDNNYSVELQDSRIKIENQIVNQNETFELEDIEFELVNVTSDSAVVVAKVFTSDDIRSVCIQETGTCVSRVLPQAGGYEFAFQVFVSEEGAERFAKVTKGMKTVVDPNTGETYLESRIALFLDENLITDLGIASDLAGRAYTKPLVTGGAETREEALNEKLRLQSILQSGALPVKLEIIKIDQISPTLGEGFTKAAMFAIIIATVAVMGIIYIRYRKIKILIPMLVFSVIEFTITLGAASAIKWTIDLAAIAGLIAAIGTGTNDQIMIIDEILIGGGEKKIYTVKQRVKRAFFIIFGAASTIIAAMIPLFVIGIGVMRGFALITIIGVGIGVLITRPAFGRIAERILKEEG